LASARWRKISASWIYGVKRHDAGSWRVHKDRFLPPPLQSDNSRNKIPFPVPPDIHNWGVRIFSVSYVLLCYLAPHRLIRCSCPTALLVRDCNIITSPAILGRTLARVCAGSRAAPTYQLPPVIRKMSWFWLTILSASKGSSEIPFGSVITDVRSRIPNRKV
jgi:hypothetical protein